MAQQVTSSLTSQELQGFVSIAEETFGVHPGNVETEVSYDISGTVVIDTDDSEIDEEELVSALQSSIADALNLHTSDVLISIDPESGVATYVISSATAEDAAELLEALQEPSANEAINDALTQNIPEISNVTFCIP